MRSKFAKVVWAPEDIQILRPHWTKKKCREVLAGIEHGLEDDMISRGWDTIGYDLDHRYDMDGNYIDIMEQDL